MVIDVWNPATFDRDLLTILDEQRQLIADYFQTARDMRIDREKQTLPRPMLPNPYGKQYYALLDRLTPEMEKRTR